MDINNKGFVSFDNLLAHLSELFRNLGQKSPETLSMSPDELAYATANECFIIGDKNRDGKITLDEFREWTLTENYQKLQAMTRHVSGGPKGKGT